MGPAVRGDVSDSQVRRRGYIAIPHPLAAARANRFLALFTAFRRGYSLNQSPNDLEQQVLDRNLDGEQRQIGSAAGSATVRSAVLPIGAGRIFVTAS